MGLAPSDQGPALEQATALEAELALRESVEQFGQAFEYAPIGMAFLSLDGHYKQVNPAMCQITGYTAAQLQNLSVRDTTHPDDLADDLADMARLLSGEVTISNREKRYLSPVGHSVWVVKSASLVRRDDGVPLHFIAQIQDISDRKQQEEILADERRRLNVAQSIGRLGSWEVDTQTQEVTWSDMVFELYGLEKGAFGKGLSTALDVIHPEDREKVSNALEACVSTGEPVRVLYRVIRANDGVLRWFDARGELVHEAGRHSRLVGAIADVTEVTAQVLAESEERAAHAFQLAVVTASPDIIFVYDVASRKTVWSNRSLVELLGRAPGDLSDADPDVVEGFAAADEWAQFDDALLAATGADDNIFIQLNHRLLHTDGTVRWFSMRTTPLHRDELGVVTQLVGALRDITDSMALQTQMEHNSLHDALTGLPNRALLVDRIDVALIRSTHERREIAVLFCDLDGFKRVNDTAGHAAGDEVLLQTAQRLQGVLRDGDTVARVGGDEFVIVIEPWNRTGADELLNPHGALADRAMALMIAERVAEVVRQPITVNGFEHVVTASIGITHGSMSSHLRATILTADEMLQDADTAMYLAKKRGKNCFEVYEHGMRAGLTERGRVEQVLRSALRLATEPTADDRMAEPPLDAPLFSAAYQPVFQSGNGKLVGFEALARLTDADGMEIPPELFISVAEETGIIREIGGLMLGLACRQLATWRNLNTGLTGVTMAVNISALEAQDASLSDDVHRCLSTHDLAPNDLILELTESSLLQAAHSTLTNLKVLHDEGVGIAIDDFGTGYASLRYLATLPVSAVKVDKSFTAGLPGDRTSSKIVLAVAGLAADMELDCVVEGVETESQRAALPAGVQVQGFLTGRPQRPETLDLRHLVSHGMT